MPKVHRIDSLPADAAWDSGLPPVGSDEHPRTIRALDRVMAIQRPVVIAHLRSIRKRHPKASTVEIAKILERRYLAAVTAGGAAVGATAVVPGIGTAATLALGGVETVGFLEATTLYAQSLTELHGIPVENPDRARALVLTLLMGKEGIDLLGQLAKQFGGKGTGIQGHWGEVITSSLPRAAVGPLVDRLKSTFIRQFAARGGASVLGKALPFGIGAAVGATGNRILGKRVVIGARKAFPAVPVTFPSELEPTSRSAATSVGRAVNGVGDAIRNLGRRASSVTRPREVERARADDVTADDNES